MNDRRPRKLGPGAVMAVLRTQGVPALLSQMRHQDQSRVACLIPGSQAQRPLAFSDPGWIPNKGFPSPEIHRSELREGWSPGGNGLFGALIFRQNTIMADELWCPSFDLALHRN